MGASASVGAPTAGTRRDPARVVLYDYDYGRGRGISFSRGADFVDHVRKVYPAGQLTGVGLGRSRLGPSCLPTNFNHVFVYLRTEDGTWWSFERCNTYVLVQTARHKSDIIKGEGKCRPPPYEGGMSWMPVHNFQALCGAEQGSAINSNINVPKDESELYSPLRECSETLQTLWELVHRHSQHSYRLVGNNCRTLVNEVFEKITGSPVYALPRESDTIPKLLRMAVHDPNLAHTDIAHRIQPPGQKRRLNTKVIRKFLNAGESSQQQQSQQGGLGAEKQVWFTDLCDLFPFMDLPVILDVVSRVKQKGQATQFLIDMSQSRIKDAVPAALAQRRER